MNAPANAMPHSLETKEEIIQDRPSRQDILELGYGRWLERGSPYGSPEEDWFEAERWLMGEPSSG
jgi:hypothetical protein